MRFLRAPRLFHGVEQFIRCCTGLAIHSPQPLKELWRPSRTLANGLLQGVDDETIPADPERLRAPVHGFQQRIGNVHSGGHEYIHEYITRPWPVMQCAQECAHAVVTIGLGRIVEPIAIQDVSGKAAVFQTGIIVNSPSTKIFAGSASACGSYTYRSAVRWPRG